MSQLLVWHTHWLFGLVTHSLETFVLLSISHGSLALLHLLGGRTAEALAFLTGSTLVGVLAVAWLVAMLLEVLVCTAIFDELGSARQLVWVLIKRDRLDNVSGEKVHEWLNFMHFFVHHFRDGINADETFQESLT